MSSRTGKNMHESSDQSQDAYDWSEWAWDGVGCQWYRTRIDSNGEYVYDYKQPPDESSSVPRSQTALNSAISYAGGHGVESGSQNDQRQYSQEAFAAVNYYSADDVSNTSISAEQMRSVIHSPSDDHAPSSRVVTPNLRYKVISGIEGTSPGEKEHLDPRYQVQPSREFEPGRVFKVLWSEPQGTTLDTDSAITTFTLGETKFGQKVHSSIRRFIIVANGQGCSQCVPITTYGHKATTKGGINRKDHAIVYMNNARPKRLPNESKLSKDAIQVISKNPRDKLEADSRVNYGKIYTVEHNVKVLFIGKLTKESERRFMIDFDATWESKTRFVAEPSKTDEHNYKNLSQEEDSTQKSQKIWGTSAPDSSQEDVSSTSSVSSEVAELTASPGLSLELPWDVNALAGSISAEQSSSEIDFIEDIGISTTGLVSVEHFSTSAAEQIPHDSGDVKIVSTPTNLGVTILPEKVQEMNNFGDDLNRCNEEYHTMSSNRTFSDSGYGSSRSVISEAEDIFSLAPSRRRLQEVAAEERLAALLAKNVELRLLCKEVLRRAGKERLVEILRRLLKIFHLDLKSKAVSSLENATTNLLQSGYSRIRICVQLSELLAPESEQEIERLIMVALGKTEFLEGWVANNPGLAIASMDPLGNEAFLEEEEEGISADEEENTDVPTILPNITEMENFLLEGRPFRNLSTNLRMFLLPSSFSSLTRILMGVPADRIWFSKNNDDSISNKLKSFIEDITEENWNWWPFQPRMRHLQKGQERVHWICSCNTHLWTEISESHSKTYKAIIEGRLKISETKKVHFCKFGRKGNLRFAFPSWIRQVTGPNPSPDWQASSSNPNLSSLPSAFALTNVAGRNPNQPSSNVRATAPGTSNNPLDVHIDIKPNTANELFVLFGVDCAGRTLEFDQIDVTKQDDGIFFRDLKKKYRELRGFWRYWLSVWRLNHCDFVQFKKIGAGRIVTQKKHDLPTDILYEYTPRPPNADIPPIVPHEFNFNLSYCESSCFLCKIRHVLGVLHDVIRAPSGGEILQCIPKRTTALQTKVGGIEFAWGLQAQYSISFVLMVLYHVLLFISAVGLWIWWQVKRSGDIQDATTPLFVIGLFISIFWGSSAVLKSL